MIYYKQALTKVVGITYKLLETVKQIKTYTDQFRFLQSLIGSAYLSMFVSGTRTGHTGRARGLKI